MAKTDLTLQLERRIYSTTNKMGVFGCFEVTIGWYGEERVDYITYDTKGIWRCYEIKASKSDFYSTSKKTFVGHYNYFVLPSKLYEEVKHDIPNHVGVYVNGVHSVKRAKKQELAVDEEILKNSLIRSLSREADKLLKSSDPDFINSMNRRIDYEKREKERYRRELQEFRREIYEKFGLRWREIDLPNSKE